MKKITALLFVIIALTACTGKQQEEQQQPQSIYGSWQLAETGHGAFAKFPACTFNENGTYAFVLDVPDPTSKDKETVFKANFIGTYKLEGDQLMMTFPDSIDVPKEYVKYKDGLLSKLAKKGANRGAFNGSVKLNDSTLILTEASGETVKMRRVPVIKE